jgi:hypothetical protein
MEVNQKRPILLVNAKPEWVSIANQWLNNCFVFSKQET